jgi:hypothetical protein
LSSEPFTKKVTDASAQNGFQFIFYCDICQQPYKSAFVQSKSAKKASFLHGLAEVANLGAELGTYSKDPRIAQTLKSGADQLIHNQQSAGNSAAWHQEHDAAMSGAIIEAKSHFFNCQVCKRWVCRNDWDEAARLCVPDATKSKTAPGGISPAGSDSKVMDAPPATAQQQVSVPGSLAAATAAAAAPASDDPLRVLKVRLAKGEITVDEFLKLKAMVDG